MKVRENNGIEILNLRKVITYVKDGVTYNIMPSEYATEESLANELIDAGFVDTIDAPITENQYLGQPYFKDGKFCRDAIDIPQPTPEELFQWEKCSRELYATLTDARQIQLHSWQFTIVQLMQVKNFTKLKSTINGMYSLLQLITLEEKELFYGVMLDNGINLNNY